MLQDARYSAASVLGDVQKEISTAHKEYKENYDKYMTEIAKGKVDEKLRGVLYDFPKETENTSDPLDMKLLPPGHNYLGPGNAINSGLATDVRDAVTWAHDWLYQLALSKQDIPEEDYKAIEECGIL